VTDTGNNLRWRWMAEPFGTTAPENNPQSLGAFAFNLRFPGQYADAETGLNYNMNRYLDTSLGRYNQFDLIGLAGGTNGYAYVNGRVTSEIDPLGLQGKNPWVPNWIKPGKPPKWSPEPRGPGRGPSEPRPEGPTWEDDPTKDWRDPNCVVQFVWVCAPDSPSVCVDKSDPCSDPLNQSDECLCRKPTWTWEQPAGATSLAPLGKGPSCVCTKKRLVPMCR
jgi:RHS repeat-associated protein